MPKDRFTKIVWTNEPTTNKKDQQYDLWRVKGKTHLIVWCLSHDIIGTTVHYFRGGTFPHDPHNCEACAAGSRKDEKYWFAALTRVTNEKIIVELTAPAAAVLREEFCHARTLRGVMVEIWRSNRKDTGPLRCKILTREPDPKKLPEGFNVMEQMLRIWQQKTALTENDMQTSSTDQSEHEQQEDTDNVRGKVHTNGAPRHELPRRRRTADAVHERTEEDRSVPQEPTTPAAHVDPSDSTPTIQDGRILVEALADRLTKKMADGSLESPSGGNWVQPLGHSARNGQLDIHQHD